MKLYGIERRRLSTATPRSACRNCFATSRPEPRPCSKRIGAAGPAGTALIIRATRFTSAEVVGVASEVLCVHGGDVDADFETARAAGAEIMSPPKDTGFGEREYHVRDLEGHPWAFTTYLPDAARD